MTMRAISGPIAFLATLAFAVPTTLADDTAIVADLSGLNPKSEVVVKSEGDRLIVSWPTAEGESARITFNLRPDRTLIGEFSLTDVNGVGRVTILEDADPVAAVTVGTREQGKNRPPAMSPFNEFFDNPNTRTSTHHESVFKLASLRVASDINRAIVRADGLEIGPFRGEWRFTVFVGSRLVKAEAVVKTDRDRVAFLYEAGINSTSFEGCRVAWTDTEGKLVETYREAERSWKPQAVRHRAIGVEVRGGVRGGSLVLTPPPHQFFFPRDFTNNVRTVSYGRDSRHRVGLVIRQDATGGGNFVPWFNAPPGTEQRLAMFLHVDRGSVRDGLKNMLKYTHDDRFVALPGRMTYTSHYHMAITAAAIKAKAEGKPVDPSPQYARMFKAMNVNAVHLGEFHGDGHQYDSGSLRLPEMKAMFDECRRVSDFELLMIPGEEVARFLGVGGPGRESGHWMSLFPRPVYWILDRKPGQPLVDNDPVYGKVYRVGSAEDVQAVLDAEHGLVWTAHPRIKSSSWAPDAFFDQPYFRAESFLGAAWKAMPADLSRDRLGWRGLDLLDDMANLGLKKYLPGEVDVFTLDPTHELYGHMNINYLEIERRPTFDGGWASILDALRSGSFFTTTGEVLIRDFTFEGVKSGGTAKIDPSKQQRFKFSMEWTYPLAFAEVIVGDGKSVHRQRIPLDSTKAFGERTVEGVLKSVAGAKWVRLEVWDVAANGAYTQPIWLK
jgi:hypothetical protein